MQSPAVLFLIFNRPDLVAQSFSAIRAAQPRRLFLAADGPRPHLPGEDVLCEQARTIVERVDWECDVRTLFRDKNLGCRRAVSEAISWFFEHVEEGIILEDDCLADPSFFGFCGELLGRYRDDERVMCVTGNNFQFGQIRGDADYYFSIYNHCWGWASWRRAWALYDPTFSQLPELNKHEFLEGFQRPNVAEYWKARFNDVRANNIDTWDYAWTFSCWANSGLTAIPQVNLVTNIGFDARATHTKQKSGKGANIPTHALQAPITHPRTVSRQHLADRWTEDQCFGINSKPTCLSLFYFAKACVKRTLRFFGLRNACEHQGIQC